MIDILHDVALAFKSATVFYVWTFCAVFLAVFYLHNRKLRRQLRDLRVRKAVVDAAIFYATAQPTPEEACKFLWYYDFSPSEIDARYPTWTSCRITFIKNALAGAQ